MSYDPTTYPNIRVLRCQRFEGAGEVEEGTVI